MLGRFVVRRIENLLRYFVGAALPGLLSVGLAQRLKLAQGWREASFAPPLSDKIGRSLGAPVGQFATVEFVHELRWRERTMLAHHRQAETPVPLFSQILHHH